MVENLKERNNEINIIDYLNIFFLLSTFVVTESEQQHRMKPQAFS